MADRFDNWNKANGDRVWIGYLASIHGNYFSFLIKTLSFKNKQFLLS